MDKNTSREELTAYWEDLMATETQYPDALVKAHDYANNWDT